MFGLMFFLLMFGLMFFCWCLGWSTTIGSLLFGSFWHCCVHKNICVIWRPHPLPTAKASRSCACGALRSAPGRRHWAMGNMGLTVDPEFMLVFVFFFFWGVKMSKVSIFFWSKWSWADPSFFALEQQLILRSSPKNVHPAIPMDKWVPFQLHWE